VQHFMEGIVHQRPLLPSSAERLAIIKEHAKVTVASGDVDALLAMAIKAKRAATVPGLTVLTGDERVAKMASEVLARQTAASEKEARKEARATAKASKLASKGSGRRRKSMEASAGTANVSTAPTAKKSKRRDSMEVGEVEGEEGRGAMFMEWSDAMMSGQPPRRARKQRITV